MTDTPEATTPPAPSARPYDGWQLSEDAREQEQVFDERADARERWEQRRYGWAL